MLRNCLAFPIDMLFGLFSCMLPTFLGSVGTVVGLVSCFGQEYDVNLVQLHPWHVSDAGPYAGCSEVTNGVIWCHLNGSFNLATIRHYVGINLPLSMYRH